MKRFLESWVKSPAQIKNKKNKLKNSKDRKEWETRASAGGMWDYFSAFPQPYPEWTEIRSWVKSPLLFRSRASRSLCWSLFVCLPPIAWPHRAWRAGKRQQPDRLWSSGFMVPCQWIVCLVLLLFAGLIKTSERLVDFTKDPCFGKGMMFALRVSRVLLFTWVCLLQLLRLWIQQEHM